MAARNADVACAAGVWTQLTDGDVTAIRVANPTGYSALLQATTGSAPSNDAAGRSGALPLGPQMIVAADMTLAQLWPGVASADRVFLWSEVAITVSVSHA